MSKCVDASSLKKKKEERGKESINSNVQFQFFWDGTEEPRQRTLVFAHRRERERTAATRTLEYFMKRSSNMSEGEGREARGTSNVHPLYSRRGNNLNDPARFSLSSLFPFFFLFGKK